MTDNQALAVALLCMQSADHKRLIHPMTQWRANVKLKLLAASAVAERKVIVETRKLRREMIGI